MSIAKAAGRHNWPAAAQEKMKQVGMTRNGSKERRARQRNKSLIEVKVAMEVGTGGEVYGQRRKHEYQWVL